METITKYLANDGEEFKDRQSCVAHESMLMILGAAMDSLKTRPKSSEFHNGDLGYIQQDKEGVDGASRVVLALCCNYYSSIKQDIKDNAFLSRDSSICRFIDDSCPDTLANAWRRLGCIDDNYREWGQVFYRNHPTECNQEEYHAS